MMQRRHFLALAGALALQAAAPPVRSTERRTVVVELFTSQGCNSCPPADALLGELAARPEIVALAYHIDYWDYIGWRDPYGDPRFTARQKHYAALLGSDRVYTPQMLVQGRLDVVGSYRERVEAAIAGAADAALPVTMTEREATIAAGSAPAKGATLLQVAFLSRAATDVRRGENAGRQLIEHNIVRDLRPLGRWQGAARTLPLDPLPDGCDGRALLVQDDATGAILGAGRFTPA